MPGIPPKQIFHDRDHTHLEVGFDITTAGDLEETVKEYLLNVLDTNGQRLRVFKK